MSEEKNKQILISVDTATILKIISVVLFSLLFISVIDSLAQPLKLIFVSIFLALALNPAVSWIASRLKSKSRVRATGAAYIMVLTFLVSFFLLVFPPLFSQTVSFLKTVPTTLQEVKNEDSSLGSLVKRYQLEAEVDELSNDIGQRLKNSSGKLVSTAQAIGTTIVSIITVFVLTFMMLVEGPKWLKKFWELQPKANRRHRKEVASKMYDVVTGYVNGQLFIALIGGMFAFIALVIASSIIDVQINAVALAGIVGLFALLPLIGTILGSIIVIISCLFVSLPLAIVMAVYFLIYQQIENITIQPYIQSKKNNMTPLMVFVAAILGVGLGGILGALVAIPIAGIIKVVIEDRHFNTLDS